MFVKLYKQKLQKMTGNAMKMFLVLCFIGVLGFTVVEGQSQQRLRGGVARRQEQQTRVCKYLFSNLYIFL